jgi:hypothetical protein
VAIAATPFNSAEVFSVEFFSRVFFWRANHD